MSTKTYFINSVDASYNDNEFAWMQTTMLAEGVIGDANGALGLAVLENTVPDMDTLVGIGRALVEVTISARTFNVVVEVDAIEQLTHAANSSGSDRVDAIIVRVDKDAVPNVLKTNISTIEVALGSGVSALSDAAIDTLVGNDGWYRLANVVVGDGVTTVLNADITDARAKVGVTAAIDMRDPINPAITDRDVTTGEDDQTQLSDSLITALGEADSAGNNAKVAQSFIPTDDGIRGVELFKKPDTGTFTGDVVITLEADAGGEPTGVPLATQTIGNTAWLALPDETEFIVDFVSQYPSLSAVTLYWIVVTPSTNDNTNHPNLASIGGDAYTDGGLFTENTTDGWGAVASTDLYFRTLQLTANQIVKTLDSGIILASLLGAAFTRFAAYSDRVNFNSPDVKTNSTTGWTKIKEITIDEYMPLARINYEHRRSNASGGSFSYADTELYLNGVGLGDVQTVASTSWDKFGKDLTDLQVGDTLEIWARKSATTFINIEVKNLDVCYDSQLTKIADMDLDTPLIGLVGGPAQASTTL